MIPKILLVGPEVPSHFPHAVKTLNRDELNSLDLLSGPECIHVKCVFDVPLALWSKFDMIIAFPDTQRSHRLKLQELFASDFGKSKM
jgi:hypothetical protein